MADGVSLGQHGSYLPATVSDNGVLLYETGGSFGGMHQIGWYDRSGKSLGPVSAPGVVLAPRFLRMRSRLPSGVSSTRERPLGARSDPWNGDTD